MAITVRSIIKGWFETGKKPTQGQFADWIDSFWHQQDTIPQSSVTGLEDALNGFATDADIAALKAINLNVVGGASASQNIPAGTILAKIRIKSTQPITFNLGTSGGGSQIIAAESLTANQVGIYQIDFDCETLTTVHLSGLAGNTSIKFILDQ